jgi:hypothetical protein
VGLNQCGKGGMLMNISFDSKGDFNVIRSWLKKVSNHNPSVALNQIASEGTRNLKANTPRNTGETAAGWKADIKTNGDITEIAWTNTAHPEAGTSVAKLIELGHGTGTGGYVAPKPYIKQAMAPVWKDVDNKVIKELIE